MTNELFKLKKNKSTVESSKTTSKNKKSSKKGLPKALKERNDKITAYCKNKNCTRKYAMVKFKGIKTSEIK